MTTPRPVRCLGRASFTAPTVKGKWNSGGTGIALTRGTGRPNPTTFTTAATITRGNVGYLRVIIGGQDVTFFRGTPVQVEHVTTSEPFGPETATLIFPQITPFDDLTSDEFGWLQRGKDIELSLCSVSGGETTTVQNLWTGVVLNRTPKAVDGHAGKFELVVEAQGILFASVDGVLSQPQIAYDTEDIGTVIPRILNTLPERRYGFVRDVHTGIQTRSTGAWEPTLTGRIGDLLAQATTSDGANQWTLHLDHYRTPVLRLKDVTTQHWTTSVGAPGVTVDVAADMLTAPTAIYGRGVDKDSQGWGNLKAPGFDWLKQYPFFSDNPSAQLEIGASGTAVEQAQTALNTVWGIPTTVDGVFGTQLRNTILNFQRGAGLVVTGTINAQTWMTLFAVGQRNGAGALGGLQGSYYAPLAATPQSQKYLYNDAGEIVGDNPQYSPDTVPVQKFHSYPDGLSKTEAKSFAAAELNRDKTAVETGTITFTNIDPQEGSRWNITAGQNIAVRNFGGQTRLFHIAQVRHTQDTTELTVDARGRDLLTIDAMITRNREALGPGESPYTRRRSILTPGKPVVDGELIGNIPRLAANARVWNIFAIPLGNEGNIVQMWLQTYTPATRFVLGFFSGRVNHQQLASLVGDPFTEITDGDDRYYPFPGKKTTADKLEEIGWIDTLGGPNNLGGYYPSTQEKASTVTGRHEDMTISLHYESFQTPFVWVAFYPETACFFDGRVWVAPEGA